MQSRPRLGHREGTGGIHTLHWHDTANPRLTKRFVTMLFDDPSIADDIPADAYVIFLPDDDPDLAERHAAAGERMKAGGQIVHFVRV